MVLRCMRVDRGSLNSATIQRVIHLYVLARVVMSAASSLHTSTTSPTALFQQNISEVDGLHSNQRTKSQYRTPTTVAAISARASSLEVSDAPPPLITLGDNGPGRDANPTALPLRKMTTVASTQPAFVTTLSSPDPTTRAVVNLWPEVAKQPHRRDVVESPSYSYPMPDDFPYAALDLETMAGFPSDFPPLVEDIFNQHPLPPTTTPSTDESSDAAFFGVLETNVTTSVGETAFLRCRVQNNKHQVTWLRTRDWHILTAGLLTYTADARFRVKHHSEVSEWTLEIKYLQHKDDGTYHCQVPTRTGQAVHAFHLHVVSPQAVILGGDVSHVGIHTPSFTLVCIIDNTPHPPQFVYWHHNGTLLKDGKYPENSPNDGGLISTHMTHTSSRAMSMLTLHNIQHFHSGNYTCSAPNAQSDTTHLFVTQRHEQAAVHRSNGANPLLQPLSWCLVQIPALIGHVLVVRRKWCAH